MTACLMPVLACQGELRTLSHQPPRVRVFFLWLSVFAAVVSSRSSGLCQAASPAEVSAAPQQAATAQTAPAPALVQVRSAPLVRFRGANSPSPAQPGETDCNSPLHWDGERLFVFNSAGHPWRSSGRDVFTLTNSYLRCEYDVPANGGRWIECTWKAPRGPLYGWYHNEPGGLCPGTSLTAPKIGAVRSTDNGAHWEDLGIVLEARTNTLNCASKNHYFAGGNGDFSVIADQENRYLYLFISTYAGSVSEQGVGVARMRQNDLDSPRGKVWKWHAGDWNEPGLGGRVTPMFTARIDWHRADADALWGPSIHWNRYLRQYVLLLNRAKDGDWTQEGIYISFNLDLTRPDRWGAPRKILDGLRADDWYPQVVGLDTVAQETDKLAGHVARLFIRGASRWELVFGNPK